MIINRSIDIENEIRLLLKDYFTVYCRPLPAKFKTPSLLVTATGGDTANTIDNFIVTLDARAETDEAADELARNAAAVLEQLSREQSGALRFAAINTLGRWGRDPARPDLCLRTITARVIAHREKITIL